MPGDSFQNVNIVFKNEPPSLGNSPVKSLVKNYPIPIFRKGPFALEPSEKTVSLNIERRDMEVGLFVKFVKGKGLISKEEEVVKEKKLIFKDGTVQTYTRSENGSYHFEETDENRNLRMEYDVAMVKNNGQEELRYDNVKVYQCDFSNNDWLVNEPWQSNRDKGPLYEITYENLYPDATKKNDQQAIHLKFSKYTGFDGVTRNDVTVERKDGIDTIYYKNETNTDMKVQYKCTEQRYFQKPLCDAYTTTTLKLTDANNDPMVSYINDDNKLETRIKPNELLSSATRKVITTPNFTCDLCNPRITKGRKVDRKSGDGPKCMGGKTIHNPSTTSTTSNKKLINAGIKTTQEKIGDKQMNLDELQQIFSQEVHGFIRFGKTSPNQGFQPLNVSNLRNSFDRNRPQPPREKPKRKSSF